MRGGSLRRFKVYNPNSDGGQKGGSLFKFTTPGGSPPFLGTWDQIKMQRGSGLKEMASEFQTGAFQGLKSGWNKKSFTDAKRGVKRAASTAISNEINRTAKRKLKDIFGV